MNKETARNFGKPLITCMYGEEGVEDGRPYNGSVFVKVRQVLFKTM